MRNIMKDAIKREQSDACISSAEREHARPTVNVRDIFALRKQGKIEEAAGIPAKSIERHIKVLIERNLIEHRGSKKTGGYHAK